MRGSRNRKRREFLAVPILLMAGVALVFALQLGTKPVEAKSPQPQADTPAYAYVLGCEGEYIKVDVATQQTVSQGYIGESASGESLNARNWSPRLTGCLVTSELQFDSEAGLVYAVVPNGRVDFALRFHVAVLRLPNLELVGKLDLSVTQHHRPSILLTPDGTQLLVSNSQVEYPPGGGEKVMRVRLWRYSVPDFILLRTVVDRTYSFDAPWYDGVLGLPSRFWDQRGRIIDGRKILDENATLLERIRADDFLPVPLRRAMKHLERLGSTGKGYLSIRFMNSASDRMLFLVRDDRRTDTARPGSGFLVFDVGLRQIVSGIVSPYSASGSGYAFQRRTAHLTPNGEYIVLEQYEWRERSPEDTTTNLKRFKTGDIHVYSVDTRDLVSSVKIDPAPGFLGRVVGFSPDGQVMIYSVGGKYYMVRLTEPPSVHALSVPESFGGMKVIFSNK